MDEYMQEPLDGDRYTSRVSIDMDAAPITHALAMRFQVMATDIGAAPPSERYALALNEMYAFLGHLITVVHQLETGEPPEVVALPD